MYRWNCPLVDTGTALYVDGCVAIGIQILFRSATDLQAAAERHHENPRTQTSTSMELRWVVEPSSGCVNFRWLFRRAPFPSL
jgi:hypothetical protein